MTNLTIAAMIVNVSQIATGYWGVIRGEAGKSSAVHLAIKLPGESLRPLCRYKPAPSLRWTWCSNSIRYDYIECPRCKYLAGEILTTMDKHSRVFTIKQRPERHVYVVEGHEEFEGHADLYMGDEKKAWEFYDRCLQSRELASGYEYISLTSYTINSRMEGKELAHGKSRKRARA